MVDKIYLPILHFSPHLFIGYFKYRLKENLNSRKILNLLLGDLKHFILELAAQNHDINLQWDVLKPAAAVAS